MDEDDAVEEAEADFLTLADDGDIEHGDVMAAFLRWDSNGDGVIDKDELLAVFTALGLRIGDGELKSMFQAADISHDKTIDYSEFLRWIFKEAHWQIRNQFLHTGVSWHGVHKGRNAEILEDRLTVKRVNGGKGLELPEGHAIVVSSGVAREFRFLLLDNDGVFRCGGFEAGFSSLPADELPAMPETARELPMSYVSDSKGHLVVDGEQKTTATPWKHYFVPSGTVVDVKCKEGAFQVLLDGKLMADWKISVPDEMDLYPLVSVYGTTQAIKLLPSDRDAKKG